jgi:hypothetical protein
VAEARSKAAGAVEALSSAQATLDDMPSALAATLVATAAAASDVNASAGKSGSLSGADGGFGGALTAAAIAAAGGADGGGGGGSGGSSGTTRRPSFGASDRHPSMHIAAQIASATSVNMVAKVAAAAVVRDGGGGGGGDSLPSILEVDVAAGDSAGNGALGLRSFQCEVLESPMGHM